MPESPLKINLDPELRDKLASLQRYAKTYQQTDRRQRLQVIEISSGIVFQCLQMSRYDHMACRPCRSM